MLAHANAPFEPAADRCDFAYFDNVAQCARATTERRQLKADARNVVGTIANDKAKTQAYCQTLDLARQLERADEEKDRKKSRALSHMINQLQKLVGPELVTLSNIVKHLDLNSPDGREIASIIQSLNQSCPE